MGLEQKIKTTSTLRFTGKTTIKDGDATLTIDAHITLDGQKYSVGDYVRFYTNDSDLCIDKVNVEIIGQVQAIIYEEEKKPQVTLELGQTWYRPKPYKGKFQSDTSDYFRYALPFMCKKVQKISSKEYKHLTK
ncbi:hypothetical protein HY639_02070 [Candidatus Woesearchaeota archaeon]|nr:hypothetical protein [Candidatus Woesearchaeota archaeon]